MPEAALTLNINYWVLQTLAMMLTCFLIPRLTVSGPLGALATVVALGYVNSTVWNTALFMSVPNTLTMQTLCLFLSNGAIFWVLVKLLPGIEVKGILPALAAPVVFTLTSLLISRYLADVDWLKIFNIALEYVKQGREYFMPAAGRRPS